MKSFNTLVLIASAALTTAQVTINPNGTFTCAIPNAAYCASDSLTSNIIIRCIGTVGQPGNCDDNLDGEPPIGLSFAPCWQSSATSGDAACSKNCIVYSESGDFTLPDCTPSTTITTASTVASSVSASTSVPVTSYTTIVTLGTTITVPCSSTTPITTPSGTAVTSPTLIQTVSAASGSAPVSSGNGTFTTGTPPSNGGSATATPVGPTTTSPVLATGAAVANQAGAVLAAGGLLMAYFL